MSKSTVSFLVILGCLLALFLTSCVMPGTHAHVVWNPTSKQFEGELTRSWLAGPVDLEASAKSPDGSTFSIKWHSEVNLEQASRAYQAQTAMVTAAVQAGVKAAVDALPVPEPD